AAGVELDRQCAFQRRVTASRADGGGVVRIPGLSGGGCKRVGDSEAFASSGVIGAVVERVSAVLTTEAVAANRSRCECGRSGARGAVVRRGISHNRDTAKARPTAAA